MLFSVGTRRSFDPLATSTGILMRWSRSYDLGGELLAKFPPHCFQLSKKNLPILPILTPSPLHYRSSLPLRALLPHIVRPVLARLIHTLPPLLTDPLLLLAPAEKR